MIGTSLLFSGSIAGLLGPGDIATPTAGYSLRPLSVSYSGAVVRVRRSGDDAEKDFNASELTSGQLSDFLNVFTESGHILNVYEDFKRRSVLTKPTTFYNFEDVSLVCNCIEESSGLIAYDSLQNMVSHQVAVYTDIDYPTIDDPSLVSPCNDGQADELNAFDDLLNLTTQNDGFVHTWYDQFGSNDAVQITDADQPKIWDSVTGLVTENGKPAISFNGVDEYFSVPNSKATFKFLHDGTTATTFTTVRIGDGSAVSDVLYTIFATTVATADVGASLRYDDRTVASRSDALVGQISRGVSGTPTCLSVVDDIFLPNTQSLVYALYDADNATASERFRGAVNGDADSGNNTETNAPDTGNATNDLQIGRFLLGSGSTGQYLLGNMQELIFYDTDQSANRTAIEDNINNYYDIY